tara:strand:+ start:2314 stop:2790 length:477 start_codon:yes stop_codon:yes gene_type:complete
MNGQKGITLIICMIVLLVVTLLGLSSIRDTSLEEKMAGNMKNRNVAFQAAESALREGEAFVRSEPKFDGSVAGLYPQMTSVWPMSAASWGVGSAVKSYSGTLSGVTSPPVYIIEQMEPDISPSIRSGQEVNKPFYRITARAVGSTDTAVVILQTIYRR